MQPSVPLSTEDNLLEGTRCSIKFTRHPMVLEDSLMCDECCQVLSHGNLLIDSSHVHRQFLQCWQWIFFRTDGSVHSFHVHTSLISPDFRRTTTRCKNQGDEVDWFDHTIVL